MSYPDPKSNQASLNRASPNHIADLLRTCRLGDLLATHCNQQLRHKDPAADANQLATLESVGLPLHMRACSIQRAFARATSASGTLGELAVQAANATPAEGQIAVAPNGDIVVLAASAYTELDVTYVPIDGEVVELPALPAPSGVLTIPATYTARGVIALLYAEATAGTNKGQKIILAPATTNTATTKAALSVSGALVYFNSGTDAVTEAKVTLLVAPVVGLQAALLADAATV